MMAIPSAWKKPESWFLRPDTTDINVFSQMMIVEHYKPLLTMGLDFRYIIDAGANIGLSTMWFSHHFPKAIIVAIEPDMGNFGALLRNCSARVCRLPEDAPVYFVPGVTSGFILANRQAVWSRNCWGEVVPHSAGAFALQVKESVVDGQVYMRTIDDFIGPYGTPETRRPTLVKMDIEGAETEVLKDPSWFKHVDAIAIECHGRDAEEALNRALASEHARGHRRWTEGENEFIQFED